MRARNLLVGFFGFFWPPILGDCPHVFGRLRWLGLVMGLAAIALWGYILAR